MVINRVGPLSIAKLAGMLYAILGLIFGAGAVIVLPILYGGMGFVMTLLMAALYNVTARIVGGVQIDVS